MKENILNECVSNGLTVPCSQISGTLALTEAVGTLVTIALLVAIIVLFFIWAWALYDLIHKRKNYPVAHFVLWLIIVLVGNIFGSLLYFIFNRGVLKKAEKGVETAPQNLGVDSKSNLEKSGSQNAQFKPITKQITAQVPNNLP